MSRFINIEIKEIKENIVNGRRGANEELSFFSCNAELLDLFGKELYEAINIKLENTAIFKVRYCPPIEKLRNKEKFLVNWNGRKYKIYYVDYMGYKTNYVKIKCTEVI